MPIFSEAYAALEATVGKRFVSREPAFFGISSGTVPQAHNSSMGCWSLPEALPVAVVMPSTVEEAVATST